MTADELLDILQKAGDSNQASRDAVTEFHGGIDNVREAAKFWASHHRVMAFDDSDILVAYATAVDLGWRIAQLKGGTKWQ